MESVTYKVYINIAYNAPPYIMFFIPVIIMLLTNKHFHS